MIRKAQAALASGRSPNDALQEAMVAQMEAVTVAAYRQIEEDLATKINERELKRFLQEFDRTIEAIDFVSEVSQFLQNKRASSFAQSHGIQPDEDLRGQP